MALPAGIKIGDVFQFVPTGYDLLFYTNQKIAAIVTKTDTVNNTVCLMCFPPAAPPTWRTDIKFNGDQTSGDPYFMTPTTGDAIPEEILP